MITEPLRYGIVGIGQIALRGHIPELLDFPEAQIVATATRNPETREKLPSIVGGAVKIYPGYEEMLGDPDVEAVLICTPNWLHKEQAIKALEGGKHVLCEKPLGIDLGECDEILLARQKAGTVLQVGHELRSSHILNAMKDKIDSGAIGVPRMFVINEYRKPLLPGWRQRPGTGGIMLEKNSHFFDVFNWLIGNRPVIVQGTGGNLVNTESPLLDHCVVTVEYEKGAKATLVMCLFSEHGSGLTIDVTGDSGRLIAHMRELKLDRFDRKSAEPESVQFEKGADGRFHPGMKTQHQRFVRSVRSGAPIVVDGPAARTTMAVSLAAEEAVGNGRIVEIATAR